MSNKSPTPIGRGLSEDSSSGKRPADEITCSGIKRIKCSGDQPRPRIDDIERFIEDSSTIIRDQDDQDLRAKDLASPQPHWASIGPSPQANSTSEPYSRLLDSEIDRLKGEDEKAPWMLKSNTPPVIIYKDQSEEGELSIEKVSPTPVSALLSRASSEYQSAIRDSSSSLGQLKRLSLFGSKYLLSLQIKGPRSPELITPTSGPGAISSDNGSYALSLGSHTSSLVAIQLHPTERKQSTPSSTEQTQQTPLPTTKESNLKRNSFGARQEIGQDSHEIPNASPLSQAESVGSPRPRSVGPPADVHLKQDGSNSRYLSSEPVAMDPIQTKTPENGACYSQYQSPSEASTFDMVGRDISTHSQVRSPPSILLSVDGPGTSPRKQPRLEESHALDNIIEGTASEPCTTFSSKFEVSTPDSVEQSQGTASQTTGRRGRKPSSGNTAEWRLSNDKTSATSSPSRMSLTDQSKQGHDRLPRQLPEIDYTPRMIFQVPDSPQPLAGTPPPNQPANFPPPLYRTLPPRSSITPTPDSPPQLLQSYRPPAVVFAIDNRAESRLLTADIQSFIQKFTRNTKVLTPPSKPSARNGVYPIGVIMWQSMPDFYKWYSETMEAVQIGQLRFEFMDVHWQSEKSFVVPEGNLNYFRTLKQYIWDLFWVTLNFDNGSPSFRVAISGFPSRGETLPSMPSAWVPVNSKDTLPRVSGGASLENIMVVTEPRVHLVSTFSPQQVPQLSTISTLPSRTSTIKHMLNKKEAKGSNIQVNRGSSASVGDQSTEKSAKSTRRNATSNANRPPHPSQYIHGPPGPPVNNNRTSWDKIMLRDRSLAFLVGRNDMELLSEESTIHDKLPYKTGAHVCGGVVDRNSGKGLVTITGKGFITQTIPTGPDETGNRYQEINIQPKQTCMIHGDAVVLYYKCRTVSNPLHSLQPTPSQKNAQSVAISTSPIEIVVRLQMDGSGKFSTPFDKSVLRPKLTTTEFFSWFSTQTRCGGSYGPLCLKFTFKDAMPTPKATEVARGNEDHFNYMRKDIKTQCEKARAYMPDLKEFVVLVTVPSSPVGEEEEEW